MSFREKSAWGMGALLVLVGAFYFKLVLIDGVPPSFAAIPFVLFVVVGAIAVQLVLVTTSLKDANKPADERERLVQDRAAHYSSYILGFGVLVGMGHFIFAQDGNVMFHIVLTSLVLSQIAEYGSQIFLSRRSV